MKNVTELRNTLLKLEKGKKQVNSAQMSEVLSCLSDLMVTKDGPRITELLIKNGKARKYHNRSRVK